MKPTRSIRRIAVRAAVFLLLGAMANIAVAWGCLYLQMAPSSVMPPAHAEALWARYAEPNAMHNGAYVFKSHGTTGCDWITLSAEITHAPGGPKPAPPFMRITRAGLPMRAFESMNSWGSVAPSRSGGVPIRPFNSNIAWVSVLPYRPMMPGFAINTLLYAGLLFGAYAIARMIRYGFTLERSAIRKQCGRCPECNYPLCEGLDAGCPECGWGREPTPHD